MTVPAAPNRRPGWLTLSVITSAMGAGPLFNFGLAATSALVLERFGIATAQFGAVLTVLFASAAVVSLVLGVLADRLPARTQFVILFGGAAIALGVAAFAPNYGFLLATAVFSGISQAMSNPTTNRAIAALAPTGRRANWIGVKQSGVQFGQFAAGLLFPPLALWLGWGGAALVVAGLCIAMLAVALAVIPEWNRPGEVTGPNPVVAPATDAGGRAPAPRPSADAPARDLPMRTVWTFVALLAAISFLSGAGLMATNAYLALFAVQQFGYSLVLGGLVVAVGGIIGVASRVWWGRRMAAGASAGRLLSIMSLGAIGAAATMLLALVANQHWLIWLGVALHGISVLGANVIINSTVMALAGRRRLGAATGVTATGMYAGFASGPIVAGALIDLSGGFVGGWLVVGAFYVVCLAAALGFAALVRRTRRADEPAAGTAAPR